jgi:CheY-like chemotaxis protein
MQKTGGFGFLFLHIFLIKSMLRNMAHALLAPLFGTALLEPNRWPKHEATTAMNMARRTNILLVDEDAPARDALERALVEANYRVVSALNDGDALNQIQQHSIDVALLALGRDAGKDWSTVERLTQFRPQLRLIVAGAGSQGFAHPLASKAEALLEKPVDISLLVETLRGLPAFPSPPAVTDFIQTDCHCND